MFSDVRRRVVDAAGKRVSCTGRVDLGEIPSENRMRQINCFVLRDLIISLGRRRGTVENILTSVGLCNPEISAAFTVAPEVVYSRSRGVASCQAQEGDEADAKKGAGSRLGDYRSHEAMLSVKTPDDLPRVVDAVGLRT